MGYFQFASINLIFSSTFQLISFLKIFVAHLNAPHPIQYVSTKPDFDLVLILLDFKTFEFLMCIFYLYHQDYDLKYPVLAFFILKQSTITI